MTSGGQCVMISGAALMLQLFAISWDMHTLEVRKLVEQHEWLVNFHSCMYLSTGATAFNNAHFGAGLGLIFLDDVQCSSSSNQLLECSSRPILTHNCLHTDDAGVGCEGMCGSIA